MKNIGGGYLITGVSDKTWVPVGISKSTNLDSKQLRDLIHKYSGLDIDVNYVEHTINFESENRIFGMICITVIR